MSAATTKSYVQQLNNLTNDVVAFIGDTVFIPEPSTIGAYGLKFFDKTLVKNDSDPGCSGTSEIARRAA